VVSATGQNLRLHPETGALAAMDTPLNPGTPVVAGSAYTNNRPGGMPTTLYGIDFALDALVRQGGLNGPPSPNGGLLTMVGALGVDATEMLGFDIFRDDVLAALNVAGDPSTGLYRIDLTTGTAMLIGSIGGGVRITSMAIQTVPEPGSVAMLLGGLALIALGQYRRRHPRRPHR
jgi:hypothetical protein